MSSKIIITLFPTVIFIYAILSIFIFPSSFAIPTPDPKVAKDFESLLNKFGLEFHGDEYQQRLRAFESKYKDLHEINSIGDAAEWSMEKITGMTPDEFKEKYLGGIIFNSTGLYHMPSAITTHHPSGAPPEHHSSYLATIILPLAICSFIINTL